MLIKVYKSTTLQGAQTNIDTYITKISNFGWKRDLDYGYVLPHPTITVKPDLTIAKGDHIHIEIDDEIRMCVYIDKIEEPPDGQSMILYCWDILKKLEDTYIADLPNDGSWWSRDSWWTGLDARDQELLFNYTSSVYTQSEYQYLGALFFIQMAMYKCCGLSMSAAQTSQVKDLDSNFDRYLTSSTRDEVKNGNLIFQLFQLRYIGASEFEDESYDRATLLDVFHWIIRTLELKFTYETVSSDVEMVLKPYAAQSVPSADDGGYSPKNVQLYDGVTAKVTTVMLEAPSEVFTYYYATGWSPVQEVEHSPSSPSEGDKYKTITLPNHFVLCYKLASTSRLTEFGHYDGKSTFLEQYVAAIERMYTTEWQKKIFYMHLEEDRDALEISYNLSKNIAKITYLEEVS